MNWTMNQTVDLSRGYTPVVWPDALMVSGDVGAHTWEVILLKNGVAADLLNTSVTGYFQRADGNTVAVVGSVSGNKVSVTLTQECYAVDGKLTGVMQISTNNDLVTVSAIIFAVKSLTSDAIIDPGEVIPSVESLLALIAGIGIDHAKSDAAIATANSAISASSTAIAVAAAAALKADATASGSPKGQYATLAALKAAFPTGTTGAYLVQADSHLYFWDTVTSAWVDGGEYNVAHASKVAVTDALGRYAGTTVEAILAEIAKKSMPRMFYVDDYGAVADYDPVSNTGTDNSAAFTSAMNAAVASGGGVVVMGVGNYRVHTRIAWKTEISLVGVSQILTKVYTTGGAELLYQPGLVWANNPDLYTQDNPMRNMVFKNFTLDCSNATGGKGILLFFLKNVLFEDITIIGSCGTGLGCDFLDNVTIRRVTTDNCGRLYDAGDPAHNIGHSGIGIGTGAWPIEQVLVTECRTINSGNYGIFFEKQGYGSSGPVVTPYRSKGIIVENCVVEGSGNAGIGDNGVDGMVVRDCEIKGNYKGFEVTDLGKNGKILNCEIYKNTRQGILFADGCGSGYYIGGGTRIFNNALDGIYVEADTASAVMDNLTIDGVRIFGNGDNGFQTMRAQTGMRITDCDIYNNGSRGMGIVYQGGVQLRGNCTKPIIMQNRIYDNQGTKTQLVGIRTTSIALTDAQIILNDLDGNSTTAISFTDATRTDCLIAGNIGYNPAGIAVLTPSVNFSYTTRESDETLFLIGTNITFKIGTTTMLTGVSTVSVRLGPHTAVSATMDSAVSAKVYKH